MTVTFLNDAGELETKKITKMTFADRDEFNRKIISANVGDLIAIYNAGAYQQRASPEHFLSFGYPKEVCVD